ncbi:alcohol dehydrogenase catalytic domain-containing protein [Candidatus Woesearchaeota archaeon]|nr:alcohol dehydrogenase catalytic domain-containing protein [Candidatus Woesearchaeota archaeon]
MKGISLVKLKKPEYGELDNLVLDKPDMALVRVEAVGLCGSDMHKIRSNIEPQTYLKTAILGHEFAGSVVEINANDSSLKVGDKVTAIPLIYCQECNYCIQGNYQFCENLKSIGKELDGAFAEYVLVPARNLRKIPNGLSIEEAALTDVAAVAVHSWNLSNKPLNKNILIYGDGAVALTYLQLVKQKNDVTVVGKHNQMFVESLDSKFIIPRSINKLSSNIFDLIFEAIGKEQDKTVLDAIRLIKPKGQILVSGVFPENFNGNIPLRDLFYKEALLLGTNSYSYYNGKNEFDIALELMKNGEIDMKKIITHILPLSEFNRGVEIMSNKQANTIKVLFKQDGIK